VKNFSVASLAIQATGQYIKYELWDITLLSGQVLHFTSGEVALPSVLISLPGGLTDGPFSYQTGMTLVRDKLTQKAGTEAGSVKLAMIPQADSPNAPILFGGYDIRQAARFHFLDGATARMSKAFFNHPIYTGGQLDTSPGAGGYFLGTIQGGEADRFFVDVTIEDHMSLLGIQQMPRALVSVGCHHQVYDPGCGLLRSALTVSGAIATVGDASHFTTNLSQADHYFELGGMKMTSGAANGQSATVLTHAHASGAVSIGYPFSALPVPGDTFTVYPGCDRQQLGGCTKLANLARFGGVPYAPDPATILDGGTDTPPRQARGSTAGQIIGSPATSRDTYGPYKT
jgi:hypothetical protein